MLLANVGPTALWYLTRATGTVSLLLLTASVALGIANIGRLKAAGWPRFVVDGLHRNVSLLALALLAVHILTSLLDPFAGIHVLDAVIPLVASYRPVWLGLGAFAADLLIAIALTSIVRRHLGHGVWRATHWLAYLCWPVAVLHTVGSGSDIKQPWMLAIIAICVLTVVAAVWARVGFGWPGQRTLRGGAVVASVALPIALLLWLPSGPLAADWARRAGTPLKDLQRVSTATSQRSTTSSSSADESTAVSAFTARVSGTVGQSQAANGLVTVNIPLTVANPTLGALDVRIVGTPLAGGGVQMTSSAVTIGPAATPALYGGSITALNGTDIGARVASVNGHSLALAIALRIDASGSASGTLQVTPVQ